MTEKLRVLIVEDDESIGRFIELELARLGYKVAVAKDGKSALEMHASFKPEIIILDLMLPAVSGEEVCRQIRTSDRNVGVIMLTAKRDTLNVVEGLDKGADDYLKKPFEMPELLARIRALARRAGKTGDIVRYSDLMMDMGARRAWRGNEEITLTAREFDILACLLLNKERVLSREQLYEYAWGDSYIATNVIDVMIRRIRKKIDDPYDKKLIHTIRGVGYALRERS